MHITTLLVTSLVCVLFSNSSLFAVHSSYDLSLQCACHKLSTDDAVGFNGLSDFTSRLLLLVDFIFTLLADRTNGRACATVLRPSVAVCRALSSLVVCDVMYCG